MSVNRMTMRATESARRGDSRESGMTLVELLVVLLILSMVAAFAVPQAIKYLGGARADAAAVQINRLSSILDLYALEVGRYPTSDEGLQALVEKPSGASDRWNGPYLRKADSLTDPWGNPYEYRAPGEHGAFDLYSLGADGSPGGEGEEADVTSW